MQPRICIVFGQAGTGKSYHMTEDIARIHREDPDARIAVIATTGAAAWGIGGCTLHSFLGIRPGVTPVLRGNVASRLRQTTHVFIDELSMATYEHMALLDEWARQVRRVNFPFGGLFVTVLGDPMQLPPVMARSAWRFMLRWNPHVVHLKEPRRQADDHAWYALLGRIALGKVTKADREVLRQPEGPVPPGPCLFATRQRTMQHNHECLHSAYSEEVIQTFKSDDRGDVKDCPYPALLSLAPGCPAILLHNIDTAGGLVNGARGTFVEQRGDDLVCRFNEREVLIARHTIHCEQGSRRQYPLDLAFGFTIHKAQGMTLASGSVNLAGADGTRAYVALSRFPSLDSVHITNLPRRFPVSKEMRYIWDELVSRAA
jgi:ATP-dependent DNA helicase PIF1